MVGKMSSNQSKRRKDLSETEQQLLHEMIETYQGIKMMSRIMKWIAFIVFMFVIDVSRFMDAIENSFSHLKKWITKS
ncbi:hypothetical protein [Bartonella krasnovii]|uniref:Cytochrome C-type biogenesis protein DsbD, Protein-disulfide reductase n=1 Tax=Bartonella krasnovii TaxID=2267275 RepID=A0A5B9D1G7_9HYPH|nr:hypothetical protein [Bartonella krasnovii]QEE11961.1 cytochrome C-type biogenesis protein DsbD, protein-disulfide reductase [Bartonella krasnovii]QEE12260.1 cytochrome C-type biogenesis protein dsbD, protein-disulfide reductase [Bartonella krasnovii]UNF29803.1 hypothetical protein MNL13_03330 [Bartonella krasnovii]UNF36163.1 hypothetical protein MNL12_03325 [Bartonella krasnovii]UNF37821.1 hypothetical protein MNL11_03595 [Bartonella krasnovii]